MRCNYLDEEVRKRLTEGLPALVAKGKGNQIVEDLAALWLAFTQLEQQLGVKTR